MHQLIHANCVDALPAMPDKSIDCIVTDLPYAIGIDYGDYLDNVENLRALIAEALPEMRRVARRVAFTCGIRTIALFPEPTWILCWHFSGCGMSPWGFNSWCPILVYGSDPDFRLRMRRTDILHCSSSSRVEHVEHPCPKPLAFARKLISRVAPSPADTILDPFMGSGTTGVAAIQLGHKFIGIERNVDYVAVAERRIAAASPDFQLTLNLATQESINGTTIVSQPTQISAHGEALGQEED